MKAPDTGPRRIAVVVSHPTQYYSPWFRWLAAKGEIDLRVFYLWDFGVKARRDPKFGETFEWDVDLLSGYGSEFVPNEAGRPGTDHFSGLRNPSLTARIGAWNPGAIVLFGYRYWSHLALIAWARARGIPLIFRGDSHLIGRPRPPLAARLALGLLFRQFQAFLFVGEANRDYFRAFGVPEGKLFFSPHSVDAGHYHPSEPLRADAARLRASLGLGGKTVILFAGKLVPDKQPIALLESFLAMRRDDAALVFVGQGMDRAPLEALAAASPGASVRFLPFANQSEMPLRYLIADLFVLPSRGKYETWGLAVNEAMHMGVPCLVSSRVGCQRDLVTDGETGWVFDPENPGSLSESLSRALADLGSPERAGAIRDAAAKRILGYTYEKTSAGLMRAIAALPDP
jgi:glycosyltransferase involved in cell wall biosynthesis